MAGADDYAKFQAERDKLKASAAASVIRSLREVDPDKRAKATTAAGVLGVPDAIYESDPKHFDALLEERFNKELLRRSPRTADAMMRDPRLAALAQDDLQNLGFWEGGLNSIYRGGLNIEKASAINLRNEAMQREGDKSLTFGEIYNTERASEAMTPEILRPFLPFDAITAIGRWKEARVSELFYGNETETAIRLNERALEVDAAISDLPSTARSTAAKDAFNSTYESRVTNASGDLEKASAALAAMGETFTTDPLGASEFLINTFLESAPMLAGAAAVGLATKNPNAAAAFTYAMSSSLERSDVAIQYLGERGYDLTQPGQLERLLKDPAMMRDANARAAIAGMIVGGFDALSMKATGVQMTKGGFREVVAQTATQMALGGGGAYLGRTAAGVDVDFRDVLLEALLEIPGMPFDAVAVGRNILKDNRSAAAAQNSRDMFTAISDSAKASKLRARMPNAYAAFVDQITKNGPVETMYVPATEFVGYFQSQGIDPDVVASSLGIDPEAIAAAVNAGGDLSVPTAVYAEKIAGSKHDVFFMDNMRVSPDQMTMAEAKAFEGQREALTAEAQTEADKAQAQSQIEQAAVNQMFSRVRAALVSAGRSTVEADTNAAVYPAFFVAMSERAGMTPEQLMDRIGLPRIEGAISPVAEDLATTPDLPATLAALRAAMNPSAAGNAIDGIAPSEALDAAATEVGASGLRLAHGGEAGLTADSIEIIRTGQKQGKKGRIYGGFYATSVADGAQARDYADMSGPAGTVYDVIVKPNTKILQKEGEVTRLSKADIDRWVSEGYGVVVGKDPRGRTEYVVIDKAAIQSVAPQGSAPDAQATGDRIFDEGWAARMAEGLAAPDTERMAAIKDYLDQIGADLSMADDEIAALIEGDVMIEDSPGKRYAQALVSRSYAQAEAPKIEGQSKATGNKHGLMPHLRSPVKVKLEAGRKPLFAQTTMNTTAPRQIAAIDEVLARHPKATASVKNWNAMMADALASDDVPVPPYAFLRDLNGEGSFDLLSRLSEGQIADADHGFGNAAAFRAAYTNGEISIEDTGRLFLWSFLSRGVSPYTQESLFIDSFYGIDEWIKAAADGTLESRLDEYKAWTAKAAPKGSGQPGAGATHNLNAFGDTFLLKMSMDAGDGTGRSRLKVLHDMMSDPASTGKDVRRKFLEMGEGVGIDNKVVSFTLLVAGFTDVMVLDRVQIRQLWNDGRFDGINLYDGYKGEDGKSVAGSALSNLTYGARGLLIYEAIEQGLQRKIIDLYTKLGRPAAASVGRYHWETWVASSQQEASHATIDAILAAAKGARAPLEGVTAKEGEYGAYAYGARYGRDGAGVPYFLYSVPGVGDFSFTVEKFREFLGEVKLPKNGVVPTKFKVTESGNGPWYNRPEVSIPKLGDVAGQFGERLTAQQIRAADEADVGTAAVPGGSAADQSRPDAGRTYNQGEVGGGRSEQGGDGRGRQAGRSLAPLEGAPTVEGASGPDPRLTAVAEEYARSIGLTLARQSEFVTVDPERGARIAAAYEAMEDNPQDPAVKEAYQNLIEQTVAQYRALEAAGYQFWFIDIENDGGYADSPWNAMRDLRANQRMGVFPTTAGYGTGDVTFDVEANPMLADTGIEWSFGGPDGPKKPVLANDLFRAVHDAFGHGLEGAGFRARGEENAWQAHVRLFTGSAVAAITSETRGQNSWLNFGPYGEANRTAKVEDTIFADQKVGLMPSWTWEEGRAGDEQAEGLTLNQPFLFSGGSDVTQTPEFKTWFGDSKAVDDSGAPVRYYTGTSKDVDFTSFKVGRHGVWMTTDPKVASEYAVQNDSMGYKRDGWNMVETNTASRVIPAYLKLENPFTGPLPQSAMSDNYKKSQSDWFDTLRAQGYDSWMPADQPGLAVALKDPAQIKSVFNRGTFDPKSAKMLNQNMAGTARGAITLPAGGLGKGETIIRLFASADLSTFMHESGHFFLSAIQALAADPQATPEIQSMYQTVRDWWLDNAGAVAIDGGKVSGTKITADDVLNALANGTTGDRAKDIAVDIGMQEQWARGFELYLMEGKAPSVGLRAVFERMSSWLKLVYRSALGLNVKISPELRSVFDRMLATDEQMQAAQEDMSDAPLFESAEQAGMTPEEFKVLLQLHEDAKGQMMADLLQQTMEPIRRQRMQSWKEERAKVEAETRTGVASRPVYAAISALRFGRGPAGDAIDPQIKLSREAIEQAYPNIDVGKLPGATKDGKGHKNAVFSTDEGGMHPDIVASMFGYQTGGDLLLDLATAPDMESVVKQETDAIMAERYPDPMTDGTIADEAIRLLHNDKRAAALERELAALTKMAGEGKAMTAKEARATAQATLKAMPVKAAGKPQAFLAAERRAGREALRLARLVGKQGVRAGDARQAVRSDAKAAMKAGEVTDPIGMADTFDASNTALETTTFETTTKAGPATATRKGYNDNLAALVAAKRQQLLNHALYNEARKVEAAVDSVTAKLAKLNRADAKLSKARDINHVKAARAIAAKFGLARGDTSFDFNMWIEQLAVDDPLSVSAMVSAIQTYGQDAKPYGELTVLQFRAVSDAINSVLEVGKALKKAEIDGKAEDRDEIIADLTGIAASREKGRELGETRRLTKGETRNMRLLSFRASLVRVEAWARDMDDGGLGPFNRFIVKPVQDALGRYRDDKVVRMQQMLDILNPRRKELLGAAISAPELTNAAGDAYTFENKGELLHAILHTGNDSNYQKLLIGRGWSTGFVSRKQKMTAGGKPSVNRQGVPIMDRGVLDTTKWDAFMDRMFREGVVTKADIDTVVKIWRLMDETKRPAQTAHKRIYGYYFGEIEPRMVDTPFGPVVGGYVPAIGDRLASTDAGRRQAEAAMEANPGTSMFPTTGSGFTKGRVEQYTTPLELNLMLLPSHLDKVLRFTHIEPIIRQTASIVNDRGFRAAMQKVDPKIIDIMLIPWLQRAAAQTVETKAANDGDWQHWRMWSAIRRRAGISTMFANVVNTLQQITGLSTAALLVKPSRLASSTASFMGSPVQTREAVMTASSYMRNRMGNQSQDLSRQIEDAVVKPTTLAEMEAFISKHGYFMQIAFQNVIDPIVWTAAYDQAVAKRMTHDEAVFEADSVVRRTQSDIQPENVSSFEAGSPFARLFSMFYSYFNAQANLVGGEMATAVRTLGWNGKSRYAFIYALGIAIPAIAAEVIVQAARGELGDDEDDGWEDDLLGLFLGSQARYVTAFLPFVGNVTNAVLGRFTSAFYDDRLSTSAAVSFIERAASAPYSAVQAAQDPKKLGRAVGDTATLLALLLGLPAGQFSKTVGFGIDMATGKQTPDSALEVARGVVMGRSAN